MSPSSGGMGVPPVVQEVGHRKSLGADEVADTEPEPIAKLLRFDERFYRLRRR